MKKQQMRDRIKELEGKVRHFGGRKQDDILQEVLSLRCDAGVRASVIDELKAKIKELRRQHDRRDRTYTENNALRGENVKLRERNERQEKTIARYQEEHYKLEAIKEVLAK